MKNQFGPRARVRKTILFRLFLALTLALPSAAQLPDTLKHSIPAPPTGVQSGALLGWSVAVDGGLTAVGAPSDDIGATDSGVVKVFDSNTGTLLHVLRNPTPENNDSFGFSVAISGTRVVVGTPRDNTGAVNAGSAYVYDLGGVTPTVPVAMLNNPGPAFWDYFGSFVAIDGARVVVAADGDDTGATNAGSAYVYDLSSATPTVPIATLALNSARSGVFGHVIPLAVSGTRVVVGSYGDDTVGTNAGSAFVYEISGSTPSIPIAALYNPSPAMAGSFGFSVAISGTRVLVGAPSGNPGGSGAGSAYVYDLATAPVPVATLTNPTSGESGNFGTSVAISGTRMVIGAQGDSTVATNAGSAYVYDLSNGTPAVPVATLNNPTPVAHEQFGWSVAISATRVVVGAPYDSTGARYAGIAYVYDVNSGTPAVPVTTLNNPGQALNGNFGTSVAISGSRMVVGAVYDNTGVANTGNAYVYELASATPTVPVFTLNNPGSSIDNLFGSSVAISGTRVVVGAYGDDTGATNSGCAYVYDLSGSNPIVPVATLNNPSPAVEDFFGYSVAISGTRVAVGAYGDDTGAPNAGSAYVYDLTSSTPAVPVATLNNPNAAVDGYFGWSVAIDNVCLVVGAPADDAEMIDAGRAYVYDLTSGTPMVPVATLNNPGPAVEDYFGYSVAIDGTRVMVAAPFTNTGAIDAGSVYGYDLTSIAPALPVVTLNSPDPATGDAFGTSVAIFGPRVMVGAPYNDSGTSNAGSAYVYDLGGTMPTVPVATLNNPDPAENDYFGWSVAIGETIAAVGTPSDDTVSTDKGAVYVFGPESSSPVGGMMTLTPASPVDASAALAVAFSGWTDASLPLAYTVLIDDVFVSPPGPALSRNITGPATPGVHVLKGRIADALGNFTEVTQGFTVNTALETWRFTYFGTTADAGSAADLADPDGDGYNNLFEYVAGLAPSSALSRFSVTVQAVPGQPAQKAIIFNPVIAGRTYVVKSKSVIDGTQWVPLGDFTTSDDGTERTVTDLDAGTGAKFYIVAITKP